MDMQLLRKEVEADEGCVNKIYKDHLGYPTFGIGHLITPDDEEHGKPVGTPISAERVSSVFREDIEDVIDDCKRLFKDLDALPEDCQRILANMMFNMGYSRLKKFRKMRSAITNRDWNEAAVQMKDSLWARQVPNRANRLIERMKAL